MRSNQRMGHNIVSEIVNNTGNPWGELSMSERFIVAWEQVGFEGADIETEYRFHPVRKWRFDVAFPKARVAIEFDGMGFSHQSFDGRNTDNEKQNAAIELGWKVLRFTQRKMSMKRMPDVIEQVMRTLSGEPDPEAHRKERV